MIDLKIRRILVPFDFSIDSINAFKAAEKLAEQLCAEIILVYAVTPLVLHTREYSMACALPMGFYNDYFSELETRLSHFADENAITSGFIASYRVRLGYWSNVVANEVDLEKIDLIVVGNSGFRRLERIGNRISPLELIRKSKVPVVAITKHFADIEYHNLILPIRNVSSWFDKVPFVVSLAKQTGAIIHLVGLDNKNDISINASIANNVDYTISLLEKREVRYTVKSNFNRPVIETLRDYSLAKNADLVAITPEPGFRLAHLVAPRFFNKFLAVSPAPVMGVRTH